MMPEPSTQADGDPGPSRAQQIDAVIADALNVHPDEIMPGCRLIDDYGMVGTERRDLRYALADLFAIEIPRHAAEQWASVADIHGYLTQRLDG